MEQVYNELLKIQIVAGDQLHFETVCAVARQENDILRWKQISQLNEIFRPSKVKTISLYDFTKVRAWIWIENYFD